MSNLFISRTELAAVSALEGEINEASSGTFPQGDGDLSEHLNYWRQRLSHLPLLALPTDHPARPTLQEPHKDSLSYTFPDRLLSALTALSQQEQADLFVILLAGFQLVLARYSGQSDIVVGTPHLPDGSLLVLRSDLSQPLTVHTLLTCVRAVTLEARSHVGPSLDLLMEMLSHEQGQQPLPLVQVAFALDNQTTNSPYKNGDEGTRLPLSTSSFESLYLNVVLVLTDSSLDCRLEFNTDLFDRTTIQRFFGHYQTILEGMAAAPGQSCWEISLLTAPERQQLLVEWNATATAYPKDRCIHQLFEAQVARTPGQIAVVSAEQTLTYSELEARANQLAHFLQRLDVGPEVLVGICMERDLEMVVALLAILKAGGAYVPLDPAYPQERLAMLVEDANVAILLTQSRLVSQLPSTQAQVVCLDSIWETIAQGSEDRLSVHVQPENLAYVMYTSGSTGRPKGVAVTHRNVVRLVRETDYLPFTADQVFLQLAPISFDASTLEIWGSLLNGAQLVIPPPVMPSLEELGAILQRYQVNTLWLTAGLFHMMVENHLSGLNPVKYLLAGGDVLSVADVRQAVQTLKGCRIINGYGPTETTTFATCYPVSDLEQLETSVPIGRPIANTQLYVLDSFLQPVPIGVPGELYIGGDGVSRGYLNRPELTNEKFITDPFRQEVGARLYRTGDLVRYRPNGNIEFLGRNDDQIKVRGFRIEPGEIETVLGTHPMVRSCVVVAWPDAQGQKQLIAYLTATLEGNFLIDDVRTYMQERLPVYMLPAAFVLLAQLPLTPNGKVDRQALPDPRQLQVATSGVGPRNALEEIVAETWSNILGFKQTDIHASFFESGGNSLLAMQMVSHIFKLFQIKVPLHRFFKKFTIADLAQALIELEPRPGQVLKIAQARKRIQQMTPEERQKILAEKQQKRG